MRTALIHKLPFTVFSKLRLLILMLTFTQLAILPAAAQKFLRITVIRPWAVKNYDVPVHNTISYRAKGKSSFKQAEIMDLRDSAIYFSNGDKIRLDQLRAVRFGKDQLLLRLLRKFMIRGGILFFTLNSVNNAITGREPVFEEKAALIGGSLVLAGLIVKCTEHRTIRTNKRKVMKIIDIDYEKLSQP
jgi:hypothetical protein